VNRVQKAVQHLIDVMLKNAPVELTYHRGNDSASVTGWVGVTAFRVSEQSNSRVIWSDRDYLIPVANLKINGVLTEPDSGDWVEENINGTIRKFELIAPQGEQVWRYSDPQKMIFRLHTKEIVR